MKIKKGDMVKVLAGKDRGKTGKVIQVLIGKNNQALVVVEGVNKLTKHLRSGRGGEKGQSIELPSPVPMSRVMMIDPKTNKPTRVGFKLEGSKKVRVAKTSGETLA